MRDFEEKVRQKRYELEQLFRGEVDDKSNAYEKLYISDIENQLRMVEASMLQFARDLNKNENKPTE